jgi:hypothetical protein
MKTYGDEVAAVRTLKTNTKYVSATVVTSERHHNLGNNCIRNWMGARVRLDCGEREDL